MYFSKHSHPMATRLKMTKTVFDNKMCFKTFNSSFPMYLQCYHALHTFVTQRYQTLKYEFVKASDAL